MKKFHKNVPRPNDGRCQNLFPLTDWVEISSVNWIPMEKAALLLSMIF